MLAVEARKHCFLLASQSCTTRLSTLHDHRSSKLSYVTVTDFNTFLFTDLQPLLGYNGLDENSTRGVAQPLVNSDRAHDHDLSQLQQQQPLQN